MICEKCGKEFFEDWRKDKETKKTPCRFCSRSCANSRKFSNEAIAKKSFSAKNSKKVKKAIELRKNKSIVKTCPICHKDFLVWNYAKDKRIFCSKQCYKHTDAKKYIKYKKPVGGYRKHSGNGIYGYYKGNYCASSWELAYIIYLLDNNIPFKRCKERFPYIKKDGKKSFYIPDFEVGEKIVEIKGPQDIHWNEKLRDFPFKQKLTVLTKKDIIPLIEDIKEKYKVKNIFDLYEYRYSRVN